MCNFNLAKILKSISFLISLVAILFGNSVEAESFCPPLKAASTTNLTCELPRDQQQINCSSSWLPNGTIGHFQCFWENGDLRFGRIKCNGDASLTEIQSKPDILAGKGDLPCDLYEDRSASQIHVYGYKKPKHYTMSTEAGIMEFRELGLSLHNSLRQQHKVDPLKLDETLNQKAQKWAEHLIKQGTLDMASESSLGQNVFSSGINNKSSAMNDAIQYWYYGGLANYNWTNINANWDDPLALDFSQVIWKSTRKLGLGAASRRSSGHQAIGTVIVAFYFPMGNIVLEDTEQPEKLFAENVRPS